MENIISDRKLTSENITFELLLSSLSKDENVNETLNSFTISSVDLVISTLNSLLWGFTRPFPKLKSPVGEIAWDYFALGFEYFHFCVNTPTKLPKRKKNT